MLSLLAGLVLASGWLPAHAQAPQPTTATDQAYVEWLLPYTARQIAAIQAVPATLDLGNRDWRRDQALALDGWGALVQEARDHRPPAGAQAVHSALLEALDAVERARRALIVAIATGLEPEGDWASTLRLGRQGLDSAAERGRALAGGRATTRPEVSFTRGRLRVTVLGLARPYSDRGAPVDPGWEYLAVRLRLENVGGEPVRYDAFQFRLRSADETLHSPVPLGLPDELLYGALEGNRLAAQIVGNIAYPIRRGVPAAALFYEPGPGEVASQILLSDIGLAPPATP